MNELMNDRGVCRTAPATPGLLNMSIMFEYRNTELWKLNSNKTTILSTNTKNLKQIKYKMATTKHNYINTLNLKDTYMTFRFFWWLKVIEFPKTTPD